MSEPLIPTSQNSSPGIWAKPGEFDNGKQILIVDFQKLNEGEGDPPSKYVNEQGYTYRLSFKEGENGPVRHLENRYDDFRDDIAACNPKKNEPGILYRERKPRFTWTWKPTQTSTTYAKQEHTKEEPKEGFQKVIDEFAQYE